MSSTPSVTVSTIPRMTSDELADLLRDPATADKVAVVDVRDSDHIGGNIRGSNWVPLDQLELRIPELIRLYKDKEKVVFHCMLSQQRGPSAALKFARSKHSRDTKDGKQTVGPEVCVLEGGFVTWAAKFGMDEKLTKDFVPEVWEDY